MTLLAFSFGAAPLFVVGVAFTLLGALTPAWVWLSARGASVERAPLADRVLEDEPLEARIEVRGGFLGLPGALILDPLASAPISLVARQSLIGARRRASVRVRTRVHRRGLRAIEPPSLLVRDSLGLASASRISDGPAHQLLVLPRTEPVRWRTSAHGRRWEGAGVRWTVEPMAASDVDGLRPYRRGTSASRIHWPALARGAGLLERRLAPDDEERPLIVLDPRGPGGEGLDAAVRAAASLTLELARQGGCRLLLSGERRAVAVGQDLASWPALHARLAVVEGGPGTRAPLLSPNAGSNGVFYVAAQALQRLPPALSGSDCGSCVLVLPAAVSRRPAISPCFEVAGCRGYALGARAQSSRREQVA